MCAKKQLTHTPMYNLYNYVLLLLFLFSYVVFSRAKRVFNSHTLCVQLSNNSYKIPTAVTVFVLRTISFC